jgi:hypothetical protein
MDGVDFPWLSIELAVRFQESHRMYCEREQCTVRNNFKVNLNRKIAAKDSVTSQQTMDFKRKLSLSRDPISRTPHHFVSLTVTSSRVATRVERPNVITTEARS